MRNGRVLGVVSLAVALGLLTSPPPPALADQVIADDLVVQGNLCVGTACVDGEGVVFFPQIKVKGSTISATPNVRFEVPGELGGPGGAWEIMGGFSSFTIRDAGASTFPFTIIGGAPTDAFRIQQDGRVGVGVLPSQKLHVRQDQNANTFLLVENQTNGLGAAAVIRTQSNAAVQNFQSHAASRTLVRWGVPLGGWNEFLAFQGNGLAMGTFGNAPFILGTSATARMTFDGDSNTIDFGGGGQYNGANFLDASSRTLKEDIRPLDSTAAADALAGLEPVTFAYRGAPGDGHVGFIAEDVPELVATPGRQTLSALEIVAVLTKVVQEQQRVVQEPQKALTELTARLSALEKRP